ASPEGDRSMATTTPASPTSRIGDPLSRVDGRLKTTGTARYAADFPAEGLLYGVVVSSAIAKGRISAIDTVEAEAASGVVQVITHRNRADVVDTDEAWRDWVAPKGSPFRPLRDDRIHFAQQPVALVVAESFEAARHAARLVRIDYQAEAPLTRLDEARAHAYNPKGDGAYAPEKSRGDADTALAAAPHRIAGTYRLAPEHHNP